MSSKETAKDDRPVVLLVDDDPALLRVLFRLLDKSGLTLLPALSVRAALFALERRRVHLVVSDQHMVGKSGRCLLREVAQRWPWIRRILYTGNPTIGHAMAGEVHVLLGKDREPDEVRQIIEREAGRAWAGGAK